MNNLEKTIKLLDFEKILTMVSDCAHTINAKRAILSHIPMFDIKMAENLQNLTWEATIVRNKYLINPIIAIDDISEILEKNRIGITLQMGELLKISKVITSASYAKEKICETGEDVFLLKNIVSNIFADKHLEQDITNSIISNNEMSDNASPQLKSIRRKILNLNTKLKERLSQYTKNNSVSDYLQDNLYTVRNNRFVIPVKSECKTHIPGLIHDQSASGATVFIEPFAIVELNNELRTAIAEEAAEIERILVTFSTRVFEQIEQIKNCANTVVMLDIVFSKAVFGEKIKGIKPFLNCKGETKLVNARHPLIDADKIIPVTIELGSDFSLLLITGPNTGGKTVCMKTIGLFCLMAYSGIPLPCDNANIAVYDNIFCDIGDDQSISNELSTFSSHVVNITNIVNSITKDSLVLLDELGGGTDPTEGTALAIGIIKYLEIVKCKGVISTHYDKLKEYALGTGNIKNCCMLFDEKTLLPTYKLVIGMPGSSYALKIAKSLGMNQFILDEAAKNLDTNKIEYEKIIKNAENIKNEALKEREAAKLERESLAKLKDKLEKDKEKIDALYEKINNNASAEIKRIISLKVAKAENIIAEMKILKESADEQALFEARRKKNLLSDIEYKLQENESLACREISEKDIVIEKKVVVKNLNAMGIVVSLPNKKGELRVKTGNITTTVKISDLGLPLETEKPKKAKKPEIKTQNNFNVSSTALVPEIMVIGKTVAEAIEIIEPYLFSAHRGNDKLLRIVHGKGTMALAKGIQSYLKTASFVESFRFGKYGEGDSGVTIVTIK